MRQWIEYKERVLNRIQLCCDTNVWPFEYRQFKTWLANFCDGTSNICKDELVALYLLDRLIVRSKSTALSGYSRLIANELRQSWVNKNIIKDDQSISPLMKTLKTYPKSLGILIAPVTFRSEDGDSGPVLFRSLDALYKTNANSNSNNNIKAVVYVDDFLGTGDQFCTFMQEEKPFEKYPSAEIYYCPLLAYKDGFDLVKKEYKKLNLFPVEILDKNASPFEPNEYSESIERYLEVGLEELERHYLSMFDSHCGAKQFKQYWKGYHGLAMSVVFEWGCPNNTLGMLRMESSKVKADWQQLFSGRA